MVCGVVFAAGYSSTLQSLSHQVAQLDALVSLAQVAVSAPIPYVRPVMRERGAGVFRLKQARHPCLEMQDNVSYIANDVDFKQGQSSLFINYQQS
jgi:DNA mismatch repair protein MSH2